MLKEVQHDQMEDPGLADRALGPAIVGVLVQALHQLMGPGGAEIAEEEAAGEMDVDIEDAEGAADEEDDDEVFDYTKAESVLHGKRDGEKDGRKKKPFDPYVKSMDAPKGMRRLQTERAGKSHTFKS